MKPATSIAPRETALLFIAPPWAMQPQHALDAGTPLDPLLGQPLLQRAVEQLVRLGARHIMVVLDDNAAEIRDFLKSGERWGCRITYHYPDPNASMGRFLQAIGVTANQHYWLGNAWSVPGEKSSASAMGNGAGTTLHWQEDGETPWTGWGCISGAWLISRNLDVDVASLAAHITSDEWLEKQVISPACIAKTPATFIAGIAHLLASAGPAIRKSSQARIHPTARLVAPCHIGKAVKVEAGAVIGPYAVIEDGAYVSSGVRIHHSIVMPDTFVGAELELHRVIARGPILVNATLGSRTEISDPELLAHLHSPLEDTRWSSRAIAMMLQIALFPLYLLLRRKWQLMAETATLLSIIPYPGRNGNGLESMQVQIAIPSSASPNNAHDWARHFVTTFFPGLGAVRRGKVRFIGPSLRSWREASRLPAEWRQLYAVCPCGLINDAMLQSPPATSSDELLASDALGAASQETTRRVAQYVLHYLRQVWRSVLDDGVSRSTPPHHATTV